MFKSEPVLTIYLRDMTQYVQAMKRELVSDRPRMKKEYEQKIVETLADAHKKGTVLPSNAKGLAAIVKQEAALEAEQPEYGFLAAGKRDYVEDAAKAVEKVLEGYANVEKVVHRATIKASQPQEVHRRASKAVRASIMHRVGVEKERGLSIL